ncbi:3971_t:CDS:2 [Cetraspora pellucida]|uniref:3971_t:CDS:1 n=1 Tax=Cetraspora pellucida TaxID=1433469 RepID=A0A9N9BT74_9GLOM|nr:3971_t:CDS:2 [Cetraspora pellucida]
MKGVLGIWEDVIGVIINISTIIGVAVVGLVILLLLDHCSWCIVLGILFISQQNNSCTIVEVSY